MIALLVGVLATPPSIPPAVPATQAGSTALPAAPASAPPSAPVEVTRRGRAVNAKLAAALLTDDGGLVYLIELPAWPADQLGREVEVTGTEAVTDQFKARVDADGAISQGTAGGDVLIRGARVKVLDL